jgi:hypothetical protein
MNMTKLFLGIVVLAMVLCCEFRNAEPVPELVKIDDPSTLELPKLTKAISSRGTEACGFVSLNADENILWHGGLEEYDVCWTDKDLHVHREGLVRSYFSEYADKWFRQVVLEDRPGGIYDLEFCLQSAVGSMISVEVRSFITAVDAGTASGKVSLITIDLSKPHPIALSYQEDRERLNSGGTILDLFPEDAVFSALMNDREVGDAIRKKGEKAPKDLQDLMSRNLRFMRPDLTEVTLSGYLVEKFRFDSIEGDRVIVSLELLQAYAPRVGAIEFITVSLPITGANERVLRNAHEKKNGFMFESAPELLGKGCTVLRRKT